MLQKMSHLQTVPTFHGQLNQLSKQPVFGTAIAITEVEDGPKPQRGTEHRNTEVCVTAQLKDHLSVRSPRDLEHLPFKDVSDALIAYQKYYEVRKAEETTVQDLSDSVSTSLKRYRGGIATYLEVLDNQRSLFSAQLTLAQDRGNEFQSLVQLYKALGLAAITSRKG
jgi:hypothetical protein